MLTGIMLTIGSTIFIILLTIMYFSQKKPTTTQNRLYSALLITVFVLAVSEIVSFICLKTYGDTLLTGIFYKIHWCSGLVYFFWIYLYSIVFINGNNNISLDRLKRKNKKMKYIYILTFISFIMVLVLKFEYYENGLVTFVPGAPALWVLFNASLTMVNIFGFGARNYVYLTKEAKRYLIIILTICLSVLFFQFIDKTIGFYPTGLTIIVFALYFIVENPELYTIRELEKVKNEIERSNKAKNDFLSNMSHEIRTPMNSIVGLSENLMHIDEFNDALARQDIENISIAGNNLLEIIDNILDISKIESGKEELVLKEYSLATIVKELASIVTIRIGERPIKLVIDMANNLPNKLLGDATKISQVLLNIMNNSVKYTELGKIKLSITCESTKEMTILHFKISDTGYGIKPEDYDKLFTKFNRLDDATSKEIEGTGLGLVITKKFVDLMGGKIWFESEYQAGTTFYIDLPQKIVDNSKIKFDTVKEEQAINYINCTGKKALIVDDNKLNLVVAARMLEPYHLEVKTLKSGKECINDIKKGNKYDIIFLDHMMPKMDGVEVLRVLRKLDTYYEIPPVVALTANAISGMKERYLKEGFNEYLSKPINVKELNYIITKYIEPTVEEVEESKTSSDGTTSTKEDAKPKELGVLERLRMRE